MVAAPVQEASHLNHTSRVMLVKPLKLQAPGSSGPSVVALIVVKGVEPVAALAALAQSLLGGATGMQMVCGLAKAFCRPELVMAVPLLAPPVAVHPLWVWMPIARPLDSMLTPEPEL